MENSLCVSKKTNMASDDEEIPETGAIFTFGKTRFAENLANKFWIRDDKVLQLACGDEHSAVITESGRLYTFGNNDWGQLGHGNSKTYTKPSVVKKLKGNRVKAVACGRSHTLVISECGVFSFGAGTDSQLGHGDNKDYNVPIEIEALKDNNIRQVSCGAEHSAAVTENGDLFVWGSGSEGQLGLGAAECEQPSLLKFRSKVTFVACGYYHTAVITELGKLYTFGDNEAGKLGLEDNQCDDTEEPQQVKTLNEPVVSVACGGNHTAVLTKRGTLFTFGSGMHGQLGHGPAFQDISLPKHVSTLQGKFLTTVSCGESHTAVVTKDGEMYTFGDGRHGKLGMGDESFSNLFQPTKVKRFIRFSVDRVACGGCHMLAVATRNHNDIQDGEGSEQDGSRVEQDSGSEDVPDGARLSQTVPMSVMSARDKRRKKDIEGVALASSLPPLNRSLPPLASLGLSSFKQDENKPVRHARLNPLNRSTLPVISIKSPSPDDEENTAGNLRRLPPRPKRRQKKTKTPSDSEDENDGKQRGSTTPRPTPLPRKQKLEKQKIDESLKKSQKGRKDIEKSGSEASNEDSEDDTGGADQSSLPTSKKMPSDKDRDECGEDSEEEDSEEEATEEDSKGAKNGKKDSRRVNDEENMKDVPKDKDEEDEEDDEYDEDDEEEDEDDEEEDEDDDDKGNKMEEETEVTKVETAGSGQDESEDNDTKKDKDSKMEKKDKKKGKTKDGKEKKKKNKEDKNKEDKNKEDKNKEDKKTDKENEKTDEENQLKEQNEGEDEDEEVAKDETMNKDEKGKKGKKSGICVLL